jgi:hypothetical protein
VDVRVKFFVAVLALLLLAAATYAASNPPLSAEWNILPTGKAASSGELIFRVTPADGADPVEVTVFVRAGSSDVAVARGIRQALSTQLRRDRFDVELGQGANVLVSDPRGRPNFSLELLDSNVEELRVAVQPAAPAASPTVPEQSTPATTQPPPTPAAPGDAAPPPTTLPPMSAPPGNPAQPDATPQPDSPALPETAPPPTATPGDGPASAPPPG